MSEEKRAVKLEDESLENVNGGTCFINSDLKSANFIKGTETGGIFNAVLNNDTQGDIRLLGNSSNTNGSGVKSSTNIRGTIQKA